ARGSFVEILRTVDSGQFSISTSKPGVTRGNHYHNTKNEKFLVLKGEATIRFRHIFSTEVIEYPVSDKKLEVVDIPTGYTHNITNTGSEDMILVLWANEQFDEKKPDTYYLEV
ncbi:polysaccharide biosynthesis C-terminal domain-containing protein, partial [Cetobacterium sp.]|uniref:polysaccharide biosynthesis C-terminal domain-containing protein n=1 Tax=Cetobacterium sp. TaxID=2071632 RepID=UPI003F2E2E3A